MKILVTEQLPGSATGAAERLTAAGHTLTYCHQQGDSTPLSAGPAVSAGCPLAGDDVDVVVVVRADDGAMTPREFGALCALHHGTPLVIAGPIPDHELTPWRDADVLCTVDDVAAGCDAAVSPIGAAARRAVTAAATRVLKQHRASGQLTVELRPYHGKVDVFLTPEHPTTAPVREEIRAVVRAGLAPYTSNWAYAQVYFAR